jgi:hypothetical protein
MYTQYGYDVRNLSENDVRRIAVEETRRTLGQSSSLGYYAPQSIPADAVRREFTRVFYNPTGAANYTISATTLTEVDPANLAGTIKASGRPIILTATVRAVEAGATGNLILGFLVDGDPLPDRDVGSWGTENTDFHGASFTVIFEEPRPGTRRFALAAYRATANGTIYCGGGNTVELIAMEV